MSRMMQRPASAEERQQCQEWALWESGDIERFEYHYEQDVEFIVQQGAAVIRCADQPPLDIAAGSHVTIVRGVHAVWTISAPISNRYRYKNNTGEKR